MRPSSGVPRQHLQTPTFFDALDLYVHSTQVAVGHAERKSFILLRAGRNPQVDAVRIPYSYETIAIRAGQIKQLRSDLPYGTTTMHVDK